MQPIEISTIDNDDIINASNLTSGFTVGGTAELPDGSQLTISIGSLEYHVTVMDGAWSHAVPAADLEQLLDQQYSVQVTSADDAELSTSRDLTVDLHAPAAPAITLVHDTGASAIDGKTSDATLTVTPAETGGTIEYSTDGGQNFSAAVPVYGADGSHTVLVRQVDAAGNTSDTQSITFELDTKAPLLPTVVLAHDTGFSATDSKTSDATLTVTPAEAGGTIEYSTDGGQNFSAAVPVYAQDGTEDGSHTVLVRQVDAAGNTSDTQSITFELDTKAPLLPTVVLAHDTGASAVDGKTSDATLTVTPAEAGGTVEYSTDGGQNFSAAVPVYGADGSHTVLVRQVDAAGNASGAQPVNFTLDTLAPSVSVTKITPDTGSSDHDEITKSASVTVSGTAEIGSTVAVTERAPDGVVHVLGTATIDSSGTWQFSTPADLAAGIHHITATAVDAAGNVSVSKSDFTVDLATPVPVVTGVTHGFGIADGYATSSTTPAISGLAEHGASVDLFLNGAYFGTTTADTDGKWTLAYSTINNAPLVDGTYSITTSVTDIAGNTAQGSNATLVIDTQAPAAPDIALAHGVENGAGQLFTNDAALKVLAAEPADLVEYSLDGTNFFATAPRFDHDGQYAVTVRETDAAGNVSLVNTLNFTLDTVAPRFALNNAALTHATDGTDSVSLSGTIETAAGTVLHVLDGEQDLGAAQLDGDGHWSFTSSLAAGQQHTLSLAATDAAGNTTALALHSGMTDGVAELGFSLAGTTVSESGGVVTLLHDGVTTVLSGVSEYHFTDGVVHEGAGSPLVDDLYYYAHNPDVWAAGMDATAHYLQSGWSEGRDPNAFFSTAGYLAANPDASASGQDPLSYYEQQGWQRGENPGANFDTALYLAHNPDVAEAGVDPLLHYLQYGQAEGRQAYAVVGHSITQGGFDAEYYLLANPDVAKSGMDAWTHFATFGWQEGRDPNAYFDTKAYLAANPDVLESGMNPLQHFDEYGWKEGRDPSANFSVRQYEEHYTDVSAAGIDPLLHFLQFGAAEGRASFDIHLG